MKNGKFLQKGYSVVCKLLISYDIIVKVWTSFDLHLDLILLKTFTHLSANDTVYSFLTIIDHLVCELGLHYSFHY